MLVLVVSYPESLPSKILAYRRTFVQIQSLKSFYVILQYSSTCSQPQHFKKKICNRSSFGVEMISSNHNNNSPHFQLKLPNQKENTEVTVFHRKFSKPRQTMQWDNVNIYYLSKMHCLAKVWVVATVVLRFCMYYLSEVKQDLYLGRTC